MMMRDGNNIGRFILLPFSSIGCDSKSSVAIVATTTTAATTNSPKNKQLKPSGQKIEEKKVCKVKAKQSRGLPNASVSQKLHRLINRLFKSFQLFLYKDEMGQIEEEMEIGFPTDVKHVTHIGLDGSTRINNNDVVSAAVSNVAAFPLISLEQFELAMAAQSNNIINAPLIN